MARQKLDPSSRRGTVVVFTAVSLTVVIGFAALAVDIGYAYSVKAQLQRNADAAALAGAVVLTSDKMLSSTYDATNDVVAEVQAYGLINVAAGLPESIFSNDIVLGHLNDVRDPTEAIDPLGTFIRPYACTSATTSCRHWCVSRARHLRW